jgi:hypothetical protein
MTYDDDSKFLRDVHEHAAKLIGDQESESAGSAGNPDDDVQACVIFRGVTIPLDQVSHDLRRQWHAVSRQADRHKSMQEQLKAIGEAMLAEYVPNAAMKYAISETRVSGAHNVLKKLSGKK